MINRKQALLGFGAVVVVLGMSSTAWACSKLYGTMTITGNGSTGRSPSTNSSSSVTIGDASASMGYCSITPGATAKQTGGRVTISITATTGACAGALTAGSTYGVWYLNGNVYEDPKGPQGWSRQNGSCMPVNQSRVQIGSGQANALGGWTATTYDLPTSGVTINGYNQDASVCVTNAGDGNEGPIQIVSV